MEQIKRNDKIASRIIDDEMLLLNYVTGDNWIFRGVAIDIWNMLDKPCFINNIINELMMIYDSQEETLNTDIMEFISKCVKLDICELI